MLRFAARRVPGAALAHRHRRRTWQPTRV